VSDARVARAEAVPGPRDRLGESPFWAGWAGELLRVDLLDGVVRAWSENAGDRDVLETGQRTSFAIPAAGGSLVVAQGNRILAGAEELAELPGISGRLVLNDAKCDPLGRLWVSSYCPGGEPGAGVYLMRADGSLQQYVDGLVAGNGLAWDRYGELMYVADTGTGRIHRYAWSPETGPTHGVVFAQLDPAVGRPDGLATDVAGGVWVALFGGAAVRRYDAAGDLDVLIELPVSDPTSVCFGGERLDELFITTSRHRLSEPDSQPLAGRLFRTRAPYAGVPVHRFQEGS